VEERKKMQDGSFYASGVLEATIIKLTPTLQLNISDAFLFFLPTCVLIIILALMSIILFFHILGLKACYEV
jgi:hypothetical protein